MDLLLSTLLQYVCVKICRWSLYLFRPYLHEAMMASKYSTTQGGGTGKGNRLPDLLVSSRKTGSGNARVLLTNVNTKAMHYAIQLEIIVSDS